MPAQGWGPDQVTTQQLLDDRKSDVSEVMTLNMSDEARRQVLQMFNAMEGLHQQREAAVAAGRPAGEQLN